jgi:uncharacterized protein YehS (DUF1456 family)
MLTTMTKPAENPKAKLTTNAKLVRIMNREKDLTRLMVGEICGVSKACVDMWLRPADSANWRPMPDRSLRLLEFELGLRAPSYTRFHREEKRL